jgi:hypothetical protein
MGMRRAWILLALAGCAAPRTARIDVEFRDAGGRVVQAHEIHAEIERPIVGEAGDGLAYAQYRFTLHEDFTTSF